MKALNCIRSTFLCLRFPFLYPRNVFTDKHYNDWKLISFHKRNYKFAVLSVLFKPICQKQSDGLACYAFMSINETNYLVKNDKNNIYIYKGSSNYGDKILTIPKSFLILKGDIVTAHFKEPFYKNGDNIQIEVQVTNDAIIKNEFGHLDTIIHDNILYKVIKFFDWIHNYPLQLLHCIPTYTRLSNFPEGWRKGFGILFCKDLKKALLKSGIHTLYHFRLVDIKEHYSTLSVSCNGYNDEVDKVLHKYEQLSYHTCIYCGKPAKWLTASYVVPCCDKCRVENKDYVSINEDNALEKALYYYYKK